MPTSTTPCSARWSTSSGDSAAKSSLKCCGSGNVPVRSRTLGVVGRSGRSAGTIRCPRGTSTFTTLTKPQIAFERPLPDAGALGVVVVGRIGVRTEMYRRPDRRQGEVVTTLHRQRHLTRERDVTRPHRDALVDGRRNVDESPHHERSQAMALSSTAIGVGRARTATVVRVGRWGPMSSAYTALKA